MQESYKMRWLALGLLASGFVMAMLWVPPWSRPLRIYLIVGSFTSLQWLTLWFGNSYTSHLVDKKISWTESPVRRFAAGMIVMVVFTLLCLFGLIFVYEFAFDVVFRTDLVQLTWITLGITFVISLFMHGRIFLRNWRQAELNTIQLQRESMKSQYDSLKNQVNPHFLFNSLNALTNLIYEDQDKAAKFVKQLSEVYRYVLDTQGKEVVPLSDEIRFLKSYLFLQQIRFGDKLNIDIAISNMTGQVAPLVLQMLVENAIKHNVISSDQPLTIRVHDEDGRVVVQNNIQRKTVLPEDSKGIGLENIRRRYSFLTTQTVEVSDKNGAFVVALPLIHQ